MSSRTGGGRSGGPADAGSPGSGDGGGVPLAIGARIRELRLRAGRSLASVAQQVGISSSALSQIETGSMQPSVNRLVEIVSAIGFPVTALFASHQEPPVVVEPDDGTVLEVFPGVLVTAASRQARLGLGQGVVYRRLSPVQIPGIDVFETYYPPGAASSVDGAMLSHAGHEVGSVIAGTLTFEFSEGAVEVSAGGSLSFPAQRPHRVVNNSLDTPGVSVWLTVRGNSLFTE
ncbi:helix-turn-helix domain-containing protein [Solwaraspora sp. WMMD937]|uniref:helix-turn-helix domain-containing protein n=1 Tax=Solwaraspora sp. WMMD937 TaxID=3016090 RepID=UPI00249BD4C2|nr:helix-turn-helix domain-containing protein [Solwaraspora sp. WMMD937]WFE21809.1 helix-turn-helix domain-containing protein [Solwaraspora sp. WMMD937]